MITPLDSPADSSAKLDSRLPELSLHQHPPHCGPRMPSDGATDTGASNAAQHVCGLRDLLRRTVACGDPGHDVMAAICHSQQPLCCKDCGCEAAVHWGPGKRGSHLSKWQPQGCSSGYLARQSQANTPITGPVAPTWTLPGTPSAEDTAPLRVRRAEVVASGATQWLAASRAARTASDAGWQGCSMQPYLPQDWWPH